MNIDHALDEIATKLRRANDLGIEPSIRSSGKDWVCTIEDKENKFNIIAKEGELMMVNMESAKTAPTVERVNVPGITQQELIQRIRKAIAEIYTK
jgi:hypothetical protein